MSDDNFLQRIHAAGPGEHFDRVVKVANPEEIGNAQPVAALPTPGEEWRNVIFRLTTDNLLYYLNAAGDGWEPLGGAAPGTYQLLTEKGQPNGYAPLDAAGKLPAARLPTSVMEYKGSWDAAANTPTLADGTGDAGDVYRVSVPGTVDLGSGPLTFLLGDFCIYSGTVWQRSPASAAPTGSGSWQGAILAACEEVMALPATVTLITTGAGDLQTAINGLVDGDVLEIQTNATYSPITSVADKALVIRAGDGFAPKISGANALLLTDDTRDTIFAGLTFDTCTSANPNGKGAAIGLVHRAIVKDVTFYSCAVKNTTASGVLLSYHQSLDGDNYATASTLAEMSERVAFVGCVFSAAGTDKTEGGNLCARGVSQLLIERCKVDAQNLTRGISLQNCVDAWARGNEVINTNDGNGGEAIKFDSIGTPVGYRITAHCMSNRIRNAIEGIDLDDTVSGMVVFGNEAADCTEDGISVDGGSAPAMARALILGNVCHRCTNGIRLESGSTAELSGNVCFGNVTNYLIENGYTLDGSNTTDPKNALVADLTGPASATSGRFASFADASGRRMQDSGYSPASFPVLDVNSRVTAANSAKLCVTVGTGGSDFATLNAAIDFCASKGGGSIIIRDQLHNYTAGTAKDVSNITFVGGGGDQINGPGMIFWNAGAGAWTGNNVTFRNLLIRGRPGSSGSLLTPTGILGTGGAVVFCENCQFMIDGSTSPSLATSIFNLNSLNARVYLHNTTCTRAAPGNRAIFSNDSAAEFFLTGQSSLTGATPKTVYRDAGSTVLYGTVTTNTLIDSAENITNGSAVPGTTVKDALDTLAGRIAAPYSGNDVPGVGTNILADGAMRLWTRTSDNKSFLMTNVGGTYRLVEITDYA